MFRSGKYKRRELIYVGIVHRFEGMDKTRRGGEDGPTSYLILSTPAPKSDTYC